ncbi:MAG: DDE-type integrase/transposase/recombinase [Gammaproteobacteria bacterium]|nr:DDE-type integrase/transposase/recombinase [Gammaproteobacteria bacterium]MBU1506824.1 DDE-type integrase/transposase/recombinase [Gammaproteobacteria bacterium]MBU2121975.1 DDE-type integrase/transposase/recombinase [Gammaproteobacteria bacterium]MBU2202289.1 DDE-type integrase/transposase/recombinase [Gammaproteobacteria bacterium]MBU2277129.1 DDE-type integrase/transposase/recombinase [Gammaproteobacteria bacterium]
MLSFARGLVLCKGLRTLEFERDLGNGIVQFKYLDTYEIRSFKTYQIYNEILAGEYKVVKENDGAPTPATVPETTLPSRMDDRQLALITFRMHYVKAALRSRVQTGSASQIESVLKVTSPPTTEDEGQRKWMEKLNPPSPATLMRWLNTYQKAGSNPYVLCDHRPLRVQPKRVLAAVEELVEEMISKHYLQLRGASVKETHEQVRREITALNKREQTDLPIPSERTLNRRINEVPEFIRDLKRFGSDYAKNRWRYSLGGDQSTRILERVEIDHTLLDIWVLDPRTGVPLGRPWVTAVIDRFSGYILGVYISFYGPSAGTVVKCIKASILPKDGLTEKIPEIDCRWTAMGIPECIVVDNGMEFHSKIFLQMAWQLRTDIIFNPVRHPWMKASIERVMREFNRALPGRGKVFAPIKNAVPPDPQKSAAILFDDLCTCLLIWAAKVHPHNIHKKTLVRPTDLWEEGRELLPPCLLPTDFSHFDLIAGISTYRTIDGDGAFFNYLRYNSRELQGYCRNHDRKFRTEIRFDPDDLGRIHVHLPKASKWIQVELQRPHFSYGDGLSLLQHEMIRKQAGDRLKRANAEEVLRTAQHELQDKWGDAIARGIKVKKHADLIRFQGLTSARVTAPKAQASERPDLVPEDSPMMAGLLAKTIPYKTFSLGEEFA